MSLNGYISAPNRHRNIPFFWETLYVVLAANLLYNPLIYSFIPSLTFSINTSRFCIEFWMIKKFCTSRNTQGSSYRTRLDPKKLLWKVKLSAHNFKSMKYTQKRNLALQEYKVSYLSIRLQLLFIPTFKARLSL